MIAQWEETINVTNVYIFSEQTSALFYNGKNIVSIYCSCSLSCFPSDCIWQNQDMDMFLKSKVTRFTLHVLALPTLTCLVFKWKEESRNTGFTQTLVSSTKVRCTSRFCGEANASAVTGTSTSINQICCCAQCSDAFKNKKVDLKQISSLVYWLEKAGCFFFFFPKPFAFIIISHLHLLTKQLITVAFLYNFTYCWSLSILFASNEKLSQSRTILREAMISGCRRSQPLCADAVTSGVLCVIVSCLALEKNRLLALITTQSQSRRKEEQSIGFSSFSHLQLSAD